MSEDRKILALLLFVSSLSIGSTSLQLVRLAHAETSIVELPPMSLTVVGAGGTQIILNETGIAGLPYYRGYGEYENQIGNLGASGNYTGVSLVTLCSLVGGLTNTSVVKVLAADNYSKTFTYSEVNGKFVTYGNVSGGQVPHSQPLVPIVAYYLNDSTIPQSDGPLRLAIVGPEGLATTSAYWVKQVVRIEIIEEAVPEFSSPLILSLLLPALSLLALGLRSRHQQIWDLKSVEHVHERVAEEGWV
jgi:hypothetical protein